MVKETLFEIEYFKDHIKKTIDAYNEKHGDVFQYESETESSVIVSQFELEKEEPTAKIQFDMKRDADTKTKVDIKIEYSEGEKSSFAKELARVTPTLALSIVLYFVFFFVFKLIAEVTTYVLSLLAPVILFVLYILKRVVLGDKRKRETKKFISLLF